MRVAVAGWTAANWLSSVATVGLVRRAVIGAEVIAVVYGQEASEAGPSLSAAYADHVVSFRRPADVWHVPEMAASLVGRGLWFPSSLAEVDEIARSKDPWFGPMVAPVASVAVARRAGPALASLVGVGCGLVAPDEDATVIHQTCRRAGWPAKATFASGGTATVRLWRDVRGAVEGWGTGDGDELVHIGCPAHGPQREVAGLADGQGAVTVVVRSPGTDGEVEAQPDDDGELRRVGESFCERLEWKGPFHLSFARPSRGLLTLTGLGVDLPPWATAAEGALTDALSELAATWTGPGSRLPGGTGRPAPVAGPIVDPTTEERVSCPGAQALLTLPAKAPTPTRAWLEDVARERWRSHVTELAAISSGDVRIRSAYSIKTNPLPKALALSKESGMFAEATNHMEVQHALDSGFSFEEIILNSPAMWWPDGPRAGAAYGAVFADSVGSLDHLLEALGSGLIPAPVRAGARIRAEKGSRFGVEPTELQHLAGRLRRLPAETTVGLHYHFSPFHHGWAHWEDCLHDFLDVVAKLERISGRPVGAVDIGGGWEPSDFAEIFQPKLPSFLETIRRQLPHVREIWLEVGRALVQPVMVLQTQIIAVRRRADGRREIVVDSSVADAPMISVFPHRMLARRNRELVELRAGKTVVFGRSCMEDDILGSIDAPPWLSPGDEVMIADVGAYDSSMSTPFSL